MPFGPVSGSALCLPALHTHEPYYFMCNRQVKNQGKNAGSRGRVLLRYSDLLLDLGFVPLLVFSRL
jgi:hypothetical protein